MNIQVTSLTFFLTHFFTISSFTHNGMTKSSVNICCNQKTLFIMIDTSHEFFLNLTINGFNRKNNTLLLN